MALKSWQPNKKNSTPQKKGHGKQKQAANKPANEEKAQRAAQDAEAHSETATSPDVMTPTSVTTEPAEPYANEELAGEIYEPAETDNATASPPDLPAEDVEIDLVAPETDQTAPASEPEAGKVSFAAGSGGGG